MRKAPILIVDDEDDTVHVVSDLLARAGFQVERAANGLAALEYLRDNERPAMILLDWSMPVMNGRQMMQALQAEPDWRSIPVVLFTADPDARNRALEIRAAGYLKKPCAAFDLLNIVDSTLRHPEFV
jgi:CheY-like chemotaxis protein